MRHSARKRSTSRKRRRSKRRSRQRVYRSSSNSSYEVRVSVVHGIHAAAIGRYMKEYPDDEEFLRACQSDDYDFILDLITQGLEKNEINGVLALGHVMLSVGDEVYGFYPSNNTSHSFLRWARNVVQKELPPDQMHKVQQLKKGQVLPDNETLKTLEQLNMVTTKVLGNIDTETKDTLMTQINNTEQLLYQMHGDQMIAFALNCASWVLDVLEEAKLDDLATAYKSMYTNSTNSMTKQLIPSIACFKNEATGASNIIDKWMKKIVANRS